MAGVSLDLNLIRECIADILIISSSLTKNVKKHFDRQWRPYQYDIS